MDNTMTIAVGNGLEWDYTTIQQALDAVPYATRAVIRIQPGIYREKLFPDKHDITLIGAGEGKTTIIYGDAGKTMLAEGRKRGTFRSATAFFSGEKLCLSRLSIVNDAGYGATIGQAVALYVDVREAELEHVTLSAHQDTLFLAPLPPEPREPDGFYGPRMLTPRNMTTTLAKDCTIEGNVDYIFGGGDALFEHCMVISNGGGYVTAPSGWRKDRGLVFDHCVFTSHDTPDGSVYLMRPWRPKGKATFIHCRYGSHIHPDGYSLWHGQDDPFTFAEYDVAAPCPITRNRRACTLTQAQAKACEPSMKFGVNKPSMIIWVRNPSMKT